MIDKVKSQESLKIDGSKVNTGEQNRVKFTPERLRDRESKLSSEDQSSHSRVKQRMMKNEKYMQKALEPSEFKMRTEGDEYSSPTRRILESKKSRMKSNQSKDNERNDSQSQLSQKKLQRNDSQRELSNENQILAASDRNENSKSKRMIQNLREHIALKLYENNIPTNNYHRVMGKASYNASSNSYIQKMLDAYNVFNYPQSMSQKYNQKLKKYLKKDGANPKDDLKSYGRNRSLVDKNNHYSPPYDRDNSLMLPELSRSPGAPLISSRKKSIMNLKKKQHEQYQKLGKRNHPKIASIQNSPHKSGDLESMPSIAKNMKNNMSKIKNSDFVKKYRSPNHKKIKSIAAENDRRELAINGLPSTIIKPLKKTKINELKE